MIHVVSFSTLYALGDKQDYVITYNIKKNNKISNMKIFNILYIYAVVRNNIVNIVR
jgi:hypothetical protein